MADESVVKESGDNRRAEHRREPRARVKVECRKGSSGLGQNVATGLLDLSQLGAKILSKIELQVGQEVEVTLGTAAIQKPLKIGACVMRSEAVNEQSFQIGVRFHKPMSYGDLRQLTNF